MRVEFIKDWQRFRAGQAVDHLSGGVIDALTRTGIVRPVTVAGTAAPDQPPVTPPELPDPEPPKPAATKPKKGK
jgi:hypothetical protein